MHISPATEILETAKTKNCGLIAIASDGCEGLSCIMLESQATEVAENSVIPTSSSIGRPHETISAGRSNLARTIIANLRIADRRRHDGARPGEALL
ncbi:hypothetical protein [Neorhizobium petrolearium]